MDSIKCKELPKEKIEHEDEIERNQMTVTSLSEQPLLVGEINPSQISTTEVFFKNHQKGITVFLFLQLIYLKYFFGVYLGTKR